MNPNAYKEMEAIQSKHWWFSARRKIISDTISRIPLPRNPNILEVGCGTGGNLKLLNKFGNISAMDMDSYARKSALKQNVCNSIEHGCCPKDIPFKPNSFDLICLFDVLEHIDEDEQTLVELKKLLKKGGKILLTVPANQWMFGKHDEYLHHKRRYSRVTLKKTIEASGLKTSKLSYFNTLLFPLAILSRLLDKILPEKKSIGSTVPSQLLNRILNKTFVLEKHILKYISLPFGLSLICILSEK